MLSWACVPETVVRLVVGMRSVAVAIVGWRAKDAATAQVLKCQLRCRGWREQRLWRIGLRETLWLSIDDPACHGHQ